MSLWPLSAPSTKVIAKIRERGDFSPLSFLGVKAVEFLSTRTV